MARDVTTFVPTGRVKRADDNPALPIETAEVRVKETGEVRWVDYDTLTTNLTDRAKAATGMTGRLYGAGAREQQRAMFR